MNNNRIIFLVSQGMSVYVDLTQKHGMEGLKLENIIEKNEERVSRVNYSYNADELLFIFTDNLLPCSCFIIKDKKNNFVIFAHVDAAMNIFDPKNGLFVLLEEKQKKFNLKDEDIEIYFECGAMEETYQKNTDYLKNLQLYLREKNKLFCTYIKIDKNYEQIDQKKGYNLYFDKSHEKMTGNEGRRAVFFDIFNHNIKSKYNGMRDTNNSLLTKILLNQKENNYYLLPRKYKFLEEERYRIVDEKDNGEEGIYQKYQNDIKNIIEERFYLKKPLKEIEQSSPLSLSSNSMSEKLINSVSEDITDYVNGYFAEQYQEKDIQSLLKIITDSLFEYNDILFPPIFIFNDDVNNENVNNEKYNKKTIITEGLEKQIQAYLDKFKIIINKMSFEDFKKNKDNLENYLNAQFNNLYNNISQVNNCFLTEDGRKQIFLNNNTQLYQQDLYNCLENFNLLENTNISASKTMNKNEKQIAGHFVTYYNGEEVMNSLEDERQVDQCCGIHALEGVLIVNEIINIFVQQYKRALTGEELKTILSNDEIKNLYKNKKSSPEQLKQIRKLIYENNKEKFTENFKENCEAYKSVLRNKKMIEDYIVNLNLDLIVKTNGESINQQYKIITKKEITSQQNINLKNFEQSKSINQQLLPELIVKQFNISSKVFEEVKQKSQEQIKELKNEKKESKLSQYLKK